MNFLSGERNLSSAPSNSSHAEIPKLNELTQLHLEMLDHLARNESVIVKSQQRDEKDFSREERFGQLKQVLETNPAWFLARFGQYILISHLKGFESIRKGNYDINFHLLELEHSFGTGIRKTRAKNRRFEALQRLVDTTDYFSEEEMQRRNPILYEQLIGRYHTKEERAAFMKQSATSTSGMHSTPLVDMLMAHMQRHDGDVSDRRRAQENQIDDENEDYQSATYGDCEHMEDSDTECNSRKRGNSNHFDEEFEEIEDEEKELFKEEFFTTMYRSFLEGKEKDFDYSTVDDNPEYDCGENLEQDSEDKYFESEEPHDVDLADDIGYGLELDDKFKYPARCTDKETVNGIKHDLEDDEDEDALDRFMMEINEELKNK